MKKLLPLTLATTTFFATSALATELTLDIYNPGESSVFLFLLKLFMVIKMLF